MNTAKRNIIIVEATSSGLNYIQDIKKYDFEPIVLQIYTTSESYLKIIRNPLEDTYKKLGVKFIRENEDYKKTLEEVKSYNPYLILIGHEIGVDLGIRLMNDLKLPGPDYKFIDLFKNKFETQDALRKAGIRHIRSRIVVSLDECKHFCDEINSTNVVIKPAVDAGAVGVYLCSTWQDIERGFNDNVKTDSFCMSHNCKTKQIVIQERIFGEEYIVNCFSYKGNHEVISMWKYGLAHTDEGNLIFDSCSNIARNDVDPNKLNLMDYCSKVLDALNFDCGPTHCEFFVDKNGPVLIEINARVCGASMPPKMLETAFNHHDTDRILRNFLTYYNNDKTFCPEPYITFGYAKMKLMISPEEMKIIDRPIAKLVKYLPSYITSSFGEIDNNTLTKTINLETNAGVVYFANYNKEIVQNNFDLIKSIETSCFDVLYQKEDWAENIDWTKPKQTINIDADKYRNLVDLFVKNKSDLNKLKENKTYKTILFDYTWDKDTKFSDIVDTINNLVNAVSADGAIIFTCNCYDFLPHKITFLEAYMSFFGFRFSNLWSGNKKIVSFEKSN